MSKRKGAGDVKSALTSDMEMQRLECALLVSGLALVQYFFTMRLFLPFGMVMRILCHYMLKIYDLLFDFTGGNS